MHVLFVSLVFVVIGVGTMVWTGFEIVSSVSMHNWEETPARIVATKLKRDSHKNSSVTYRATARYEYTYRGRQYTGDRVEVHRGVDNTNSFQKRVHEELSEHRKSGKPFRCYVNPANPSEAVLYRDLRWEMLGFRAIFVVVFGGIGFVILAAQRIASRKKEKRKMLAALHPGEPWLWRRAWADGKINSSNKVAVLYPVALALFWNLFPTFIWFQLWRAERLLPKDQMVVYFAIAFTVIGAMLLVWAFFAVLRWQKYRRSLFEMASTPGVIGGQLAGVVRTSVKVEPEDGFQVKLSCVHCKKTRQGSKRRIVRNLVWQDEQTLSRDLLEYNTGGSAIPVLFQIPYECRPTDDQDADGVVIWNLTVAAKTPGIDYHATFEVPVFKTTQSDPNFVVDRSLIDKYTVPENPERDLHDSGVLKTMSPNSDGWRFIFPMARTPGVGVGMTLVTIVFGAVPFFIHHMNGGFSFIGVVFGGVFGLFSLLFLAMTLDAWFYRSVVDVTRRGIIVTGGLFGIGSSRWIDQSEVVEISPRTRMGSGEGETRKEYFDIDVVCKDKTHITIGKRVPGKRLATAVIRQIEEALL